jgi:hypothetical protein
MKCPSCGAESNGAFCADCGAPLSGAKCRACSAPLQPGANFCTSCGAAVREAATSSSSAPWLLAGAALVGLIAVLALPMFKGLDDRAERVPIDQFEKRASAEPVSGSAPGPLTGTPREQADRLFNRVMSERENGDTARAKFFLPMAIQAFEMAGDLDADGLYHLSLLQAFAGDEAAARKTAQRILDKDAHHLLGLAAAADAARAAGDNAAARKYYQQFLSAYDAEMKKQKIEYQDHSRMIVQLKTQAEEFIRR